MNTPVKFEVAKLLKEKSWTNPTLHYYFEDDVFVQNELRCINGMDYGSEYTVEFSQLMENWNDDYLTKKNGDRCFGCSKDKGYFETFSAPTIAEVVVWLYEKHGIYIWVEQCENSNKFQWFNRYDTSSGKCKDYDEKFYTLPTEAYEAAIEYTLTKLL